MSSFSLNPAAFREIKLFISNVPFSTNEAELRAALMARGLRVSVVKIPRGPQGRSRGYGFATVLSQDPAKDILDLYGLEVGGRAIGVQLSEDTRREIKGSR